jgi:hypothetical protein
MRQFQVPGVIGASRQFAIRDGGGSVACIGRGLGEGMGAGIIRPEQAAASAITAATATNLPSRLLRFAFIASVWNVSPVPASPA